MPPLFSTKVVKAHGWSSDDALDWAAAQRITPPADVALFLTFRQEWLAGQRTRTSAKRAFTRAFPLECTENFDGICRCRMTDSPKG